MNNMSSPFDSLNPVSGSFYQTLVFFADSKTTPFDTNLPSFRASSASSVSNNSFWSRRIGGISSDSGLSIAVDGSGNVYTTGVFNGSVDLDGNGTPEISGANSQDIFVIKQSADGNIAWARQIGNTGTELGGKLAVDASGNVYVTGSFTTGLDLNAIAILI
ncbi:MAG: hypothetical protein HC908_06460 [Calothrix sp. SM1_7_51]|nr:hypothetical protein [Calothrix sp. SM1_7_51]